MHSTLDYCWILSSEFSSESHLYTENSALNHRLQADYIPVRDKLYEHDNFDDEITFPIIASSSKEMATKLATYKANQLPGGKYWSPSPAVKEALKDLDPTNNACESILGLNDWLQKTTPNMTQRTVSAMVQTKKNGTMAWLMKQDGDKETNIVNLARTRAHRVQELYKSVNEEHRLYRKQQRRAEEERMRVKRARLEKKTEELTRVPIIATMAKLDEAIDNTEGRTEKQREAARIDIIKKQLQLRLPDKRIALSEKGKKKTSQELRRELEQLLRENEEHILQKLVEGARLLHELQEENSADSTTTRSYEGEIVKVSGTSITIRYTGYNSLFTWSQNELVEDIQEGYLTIVANT